MSAPIVCIYWPTPKWWKVSSIRAGRVRPLPYTTHCVTFGKVWTSQAGFSGDFHPTTACPSHHDQDGPRFGAPISIHLNAPGAIFANDLASAKRYQFGGRARSVTGCRSHRAMLADRAGLAPWRARRHHFPENMPPQWTRPNDLPYAKNRYRTMRRCCLYGVMGQAVSAKRTLYRGQRSIPRLI